MPARIPTQEDRISERHFGRLSIALERPGFGAAGITIDGIGTPSNVFE